MTNIATTNKRSIMHKLAGVFGLLLILSFFSLSVYSEIAGDPFMILSVKKFILVAIPAMALVVPMAGSTGRKMAEKRTHTIIIKKKKRFKLIAFNGVLLSAFAIILYIKASKFDFDVFFWTFQILEFIFGLINISLFTLMIRDGLTLSGKIKSKSLN